MLLFLYKFRKFVFTFRDLCGKIKGTNSRRFELDKFILHSAYKPTGDQPQAIEKLTEGVLHGYKEQTLLGVTGSGKTFTMANIIATAKTKLNSRSFRVFIQILSFFL